MTEKKKKKIKKKLFIVDNHIRNNLILRYNLDSKCTRRLLTINQLNRRTKIIEKKSRTSYKFLMSRSDTVGAASLW